MRASYAQIAGAMFFLLLGLGSSGQQIIQENNELSAPAIWRDGIGSGFNADTWSLGIMAGAGVGTEVLGTKDHHSLALANVNAAWILPESARHSIFACNLELRGELFAGGQFRPDSRYLGGFTAMARYDFATGRRWVPFVDVGAGFSGTDIGRPDLGCIFEFNIQLGGGIYYFFRPNTAVSLEYRWLHLSDASTTHYNNGVNTQMVLGGITWFF